MSTKTPRSSDAARLLRIGFLALTDAAPLIVAQQLGYFERRGLRVALQREVGWATIREKIVHRELDAAQALAPMLWSAHLGLGCVPNAVLTSFVFSLNGNALTLSNALHAAGVRDAASLRAIARARRGERRLTLGVVFPFSSHHLHLRQWLKSGGIDPDADVRIAVVPPAQMFRNLQAGTIDGFWSGEPWNSFAVRSGIAWCPTWSAAQAPGHVEKVLMVTEDFAAKRTGEHAALVGALAEAAEWCDVPENRDELARLLGAAQFLNLPARVIAPALLGRFDCGHGRVEQVPDFLTFHRNEANVPTPGKGAALQSELVSAGLLPADVDPELPRRLFREDLYRDALNLHHTHETISLPDFRGVVV
ncbi:MAG TPA: CmpA/NrtA family ABC transporter substrate-binding protein [Opitutus sp.]|nr:CmpA/NrtA family ABC transporter substrate-binding protein [Opitutus sp.]